MNVKYKLLPEPQRPIGWPWSPIFIAISLCCKTTDMVLLYHVVSVHAQLLPALVLPTHKQMVRLCLSRWLSLIPVLTWSHTNVLPYISYISQTVIFWITCWVWAETDIVKQHITVSEKHQRHVVECIKAASVLTLTLTSNPKPNLRSPINSSLVHNLPIPKFLENPSVTYSANKEKNTGKN